MSEWWGYALRDFLLFAPRTYWRLFQLENAEFWPLPLVTLALGAGVLVLLVRPRPWSGRAIATVMAVAWAWVGWSFVATRYAAINWAADYAVPVFVAEALLLAGLGALAGRLNFATGRDPARVAGLALYIYALALHPLLAPLSGRPLAQAEVVGIAPDPTAIATLGLAAMLPRGAAAPLVLVVPVLWCLASWATLATMGAWQSWLPLGAAALAVAARLRPPRARARPDG